VGPHWYHESQWERSRSPLLPSASTFQTWAPLGALSFEGETHGTHGTPQLTRYCRSTPRNESNVCFADSFSCFSAQERARSRRRPPPCWRTIVATSRWTPFSPSILGYRRKSCFICSFRPVELSCSLPFCFSLFPFYLSLSLSLSLTQRDPTIRVYLGPETKTCDHSSLWIWMLDEESFPFGTSVKDGCFLSREWREWSFSC